MVACRFFLNRQKFFFLEKKPKNLSMSEAAWVPEASSVALQWLEKTGNIQAGQDVLIYGSSGGIGSFAIQIAKKLGAHVTAVCSTKNIDLVKSLGAEKVIDYTTDDFAKWEQKYDIIMITRWYRPIMDFVWALKKWGTYVKSGGSIPQFFQILLLWPIISLFTGKKAKVSIIKTNLWLDRISKWIEDGDMKPLIDREYPLEEVGKAIEYVENGHARGRVIIRVR